eukprot:Transcript_457.p1 GENE.Transcript_457~~Transcript_457.p1  ORF type:complete len:304 (-),score=69.07 Transcript_457:77-988(-)
MGVNMLRNAPSWPVFSHCSMDVAAPPPTITTRPACLPSVPWRSKGRSGSCAPLADPPAWTRPPEPDSLNRYGWSWQPGSSVDENYMDLACLIARNSTCKDGHMGCVVVRGVEQGQGEARAPQQHHANVVLCTINSPLFGEYRSDCHAEANAVAECAARGEPTRGASVYVTRSPCVACFKLLAASGVRRICAPQPLESEECAASAATLGIEVRAVADTPERAACRDELGRAHEDMGAVRALREQQKVRRHTTCPRARQNATRPTLTRHPDPPAHTRARRQLLRKEGKLGRKTIAHEVSVRGDET